MTTHVWVLARTPMPAICAKDAQELTREHSCGPHLRACLVTWQGCHPLPSHRGLASHADRGTRVPVQVSFDPVWYPCLYLEADWILCGTLLDCLAACMRLWPGSLNKKCQPCAFGLRCAQQL
jgi:hypothetical protein